jgi:hypothetical protein
MFNVYATHGGTQIRLPDEPTVDHVRSLADAAAALKYDALYRIFGANGFVTAFSVLNGEVREHKDVTIPTAHW